jgi:5-methylcytosine-specific restriction enzyme B
MNDSLGCWQFVHDMKAGDWVVIKRGTSHLFAWGRVVSDYRYDESRAEYDHVRKVEWQRLGSWPLPKDRRIAAKALTDFTKYKDWVKFAWTYTSEEHTRIEEGAPDETYNIKEATTGLFISLEQFQSYLDILARRKNLILQGPPGVGKSFMARRFAYALIGKRRPEQVQMIQFHQSYGYEDFVQGWRPNAQQGFSLQDGVFHRFCVKAAADPQNKYVFIIDEINRGNLSKILGGDAIDRERQTWSRVRDALNVFAGCKVFCSGQHLCDPDDEHGGPFSGDGGLRAAAALRFRQDRAGIRNGGVTDELARSEVPEDVIVRIVERMVVLNKRIGEDPDLGHGFQIGHSFFVPQETDEVVGDEWYRQIVRTEIQPLLEEYWSEDPDRVADSVAMLIQ